MKKFYSLLICTAILMTGCTQQVAHTSSPATPISKTQIATAQASTYSTVKGYKKQPSIPADKLILDRPVIDTANIFTESERQQLDTKLRKLSQQGIFQGGIVTVQTTGDIVIVDYAMSVANRWKLGSKQNNNGVCIVIAVQDTNLYILTGTDIDHTLTNAKVKNVIDKVITPQFSHAQYYQGIDAGLDKLSSIVKASKNN